MEAQKSFYNVHDVCKVLECKESLAYKVIRQLNDELKAKGFIVITGKVNAAYFNERIYRGGGT